MPFARYISTGGVRSSSGCPDGMHVELFNFEAIDSNNTAFNVSLLGCVNGEKNSSDVVMITLVCVFVPLGVIGLLWFLYGMRVRQIYCFKREPPRPQTEDSAVIHDALLVHPKSDSQALFNALGPVLHKDFLRENLSNELRIALAGLDAPTRQIAIRYAQDNHKGVVLRYLVPEITIIQVKPRPDYTSADGLIATAPSTDDPISLTNIRSIATRKN